MVDLTPICKDHNIKMEQEEENGYRHWICEQCELEKEKEKNY